MAEKRVEFRWDGDGGVHVEHDDSVGLTDLTQGLAALCYIVAANIYRREGRAGLDELYVTFCGAITRFLADLEAGEMHGTVIEQLARG